MKKLLLTAAIVCAAAIVNAATASWSATSIAYCNGDTAMANYTAFLIDNTADTYADFAAAYAAIAKDGASATGVIATKDGLKDMTGKMSLTAAGTTISGGPYVAGQKLDIMTILVHESNGTATHYLGMEADQKQFNNSLALNASFGAQTSAVWTEVVPEPTSGLLMLLGMAGLALRRRRA